MVTHIYTLKNFTILIPDENELCIQRGIVLELLHLSKSSNSVYAIPPPPPFVNCNR
jgi:hypothetical protein